MELDIEYLGSSLNT